MFYFSNCCFNVSLCSIRCEFGIAIMFRSQEFKNSIEKYLKIREKDVNDADNMKNSTICIVLCESK